MKSIDEMIEWLEEEVMDLQVDQIVDALRRLEKLEKAGQAMRNHLKDNWLPVPECVQAWDTIVSGGTLPNHTATKET